MLNRNDITPLYQQLEQQLKEDIRAGNFDDRLPSETELSRQYKVSAITVKKAMANLAEQGVVQRKQGKGTFVVKPKRTRDLHQIISFSEACHRNNMTPGSEILKQEVIAATSEMQQALETDEETVILIARLRLADGQPMTTETNWFPMAYEFLLQADLQNKSLFETIQQEKKVVMYSARRTIDICYATPKEARMLQVQPSLPLLRVKSIVYSVEGEPVFVGHQKINSEHFQLTL